MDFLPHSAAIAFICVQPKFRDPSVTKLWVYAASASAAGITRQDGSHLGSLLSSQSLRGKFDMSNIIGTMTET